MANMHFTDAAEFDSTAGAVSVPTSSFGSTSGIAGVLQSIATRLTMSRQRRIDSEVGDFLASHGGQLTDDLERQISRRFGSMA